MLTDVHLPEQCAPAAEVVDVLQIPAFLCRQTDLLVAAGATGKPVNVKKGQWMHPEGMRGAVEKVRASVAPAATGRSRRHRARHASSATAISSSTCARFTRMREACEAPVIFDATHSVQQPGQGEGGASGGAREFIPPLDAAPRSPPAPTACSSRRIPIRTMRRATGRTCSRSTATSTRCVDASSAPLGSIGRS